MIAVIFEAGVIPEQQYRYLELAEALKPQLANIDGFISIERFQSLNNKGKLLSLSFWRDEEAVMLWKKNLHHAAAQAEGRATIFSYYHIRVVQTLRDYHSESGVPSHV
ncbi:antibiotic biosynthesis monooxygenase [Citrobacter sp. JGM124]|uniref:antibiotic biosynthesis monooxygenase family protein n=1 Tax=Citrobacter sp. JGM124 TaxID=2799789 RepID=UPI001BA6854D|nr:antibiotic biosynthesis monooxygenase [Citrobacter sp. JGM124]MBS0849879.1 antibiotic biosynthesis monooxygenase [Citrobacter sp. JGM124]